MSRLLRDGETFTYGLWVPEGYDPARPWPLLLTLHGTNRNDDPRAGPLWMSAWLRCAAAREKFILVAPTTVRWTWGNLKAHARILQGLATGIGFVGGGAILKSDTHVRGTATAASIWAMGAMGAAVAYRRIEIAILLSLVTIAALRSLEAWKQNGAADS